VIPAILGVVTIVCRDWIELVLGIDPDHDSGALEWLLVAIFAAIAIACAVAVRFEWRGIRLERGG
jgi:hypothetical protein